MEARAEDNKFSNIFCMKEPDYVMKIMVSLTKLDELESARTGSDAIDSSRKNDTKQFTYQHPFCIHFRYRHQLYDHSNRRYAPI